MPESGRRGIGIANLSIELYGDALLGEIEAIQIGCSFSAAATIGLAQVGVFLRSRGLRIFPFFMFKTSFGLGIFPAAGFASVVLSNSRKAVIRGKRSMRFRRLCS